MAAFAQLATFVCTNSATVAQVVILGRLPRRAISLICATGLVVGCTTEPVKPKEPVAPPDEWAALPKSSEWLYAAGDFSGSRKDECAEVAKVIQGEAECQGSSCDNAKELSKDWLARCSKLDAADVAKVKELSATFAERSEKPDSPCMLDRKAILDGKCGEDKTCETAAQKWSTRCAQAEGSPLGVRIVATFVARRVKDHDIELDVRPCTDLRSEIAAAVTCADKFKCDDAASKIDTYRSRCEDEGDRPSVSLALAEMTILAAAERKTEPIQARADDDTSTPLRAKLAPMLADGSGLIVSVCGVRPAGFDAYMTARKECDPSGSIVIVRTFKLQGGYEVRMGRVPPGDTAAFVAKYPSLLLAGEREILDKERAATFTAQLAAAEKLAADAKTAVQGGLALRKLLHERGREIYRSDAMRAAITAKDASFVAAFKELGKTKAAAKGKAELASIALRGQKHAFADMDEDGSVRFGAVSWAVLFDTSALLPQSHAAYLTAMKPLLKKTAKEKPSEDVDANEARAFGSLGDECQAGVTSAKNAERSLLECAFGQRTCDAAHVESLQKAFDSSRASSESAFVQASIFTMTAVGKANEFYKKVMTTAQCEAPSW
jgi:hypothetical protein